MAGNVTLEYLLAELITSRGAFILQNAHGSMELQGDDLYLSPTEEWITIYHEGAANPDHKATCTCDAQCCARHELRGSSRRPRICSSSRLQSRRGNLPSSGTSRASTTTRRERLISRRTRKFTTHLSMPTAVSLRSLTRGSRGDRRPDLNLATQDPLATMAETWMFFNLGLNSFAGPAKFMCG